MNKKKLLWGITIFLGIILVALISYYFLKPEFKINNYEKNISINYKDKFKKNVKVCYGNKIKCIDVKPIVSGKVDSNKLGEYLINYTFIYRSNVYNLNQTVKVVDKELPKIEVESQNVCPNGKLYGVKYKITDNYDGDITKLGKASYKDKNIFIEATDSSKNKSVKIVSANIGDSEAPKITLKGNKTIYLETGSKYDDEGVDVSDNCDDKLKVKTDSNLDTNTPGSYKITYTVTDSSNNTSSEERIINVYNVKKGERTVYLTFDDGPSEHTGRLLDVLSKYGVKATFFVTGNGSDEMILREYQEGHSIGLHTNTHDYSYVYSSVNNYFDDLNAVRDRVKRITGYESNLIRFPGGSSNTVSMNYDGGIHIMSILTDEVEKRGFIYFDWNVSSGDAGGTDSSDGVYNNVISTLKEGSSVVLQHDVKGFSVDAVERIIQYCLSNGYHFERLEPGSPTMHHGVYN